MREAAFKMIKFAKEKGCTVIVSSSDSTDHFEQYLEEGADFISLGEAEQTLAGTGERNRTKNKIDFLLIPGLAYHHKNASYKNSAEKCDERPGCTSFSRLGPDGY